MWKWLRVAKDPVTRFIFDGNSSIQGLMKLNSVNLISLLANKKQVTEKKPHKTTFLQMQQGTEEMLHVR